MIRQHDGTIAAEDPYEAARRIQSQAPGWLVWWAPANRKLFAMPRSGLLVLVEGGDSRELVDRMTGCVSAERAPI